MRSEGVDDEERTMLEEGEETEDEKKIGIRCSSTQ